MTDPLSQPAFEDEVLLAVMREARAYCEARIGQPTADRRDPPRPVEIAVVTRRAVDRLQERIAQDATRLLFRRGFHLVRVNYLRDDGHDDAYIDVSVDDEPDRSLTTSERLDSSFTVAVPLREDSGDRGARLVLHYRDQPVFATPLHPANVWRAFGRGLPPQFDVAQIRVPARVRVIPRGALLLVRYWAGDLALIRTGRRPEYRVVIDGDEVATNERVVCASYGTIEFRRLTGPHTVLFYQVDLERQR